MIIRTSLPRIQNEIRELLGAAYDAGTLSEVVQALMEPICDAVNEEGVLRGVQVWIEAIAASVEDAYHEDMCHRISQELDRSMTTCENIRNNF